MKKIYLFLILAIVPGVLVAQLNNYANRMEHIFGAINKGNISSGLLKEGGIRLNEVEAYNGSLSTINFVDKTQWQSLYWSLYSMRMGTNSSLQEPGVVFTQVENQISANPDIITLSALFYNYQQYKANAYTNGDVNIVSDRIYDVSGRNPYETKTAFGAFFSKSYVTGGSTIFRLPSSLIFTNTSKTLSSVSIDFGNGQGYQAIALNSNKAVNYLSSGEKEIKVKFVYVNGPTLYSHAKIYVEAPVTNPQAKYGEGTPDMEFSVTGAPYQGSSAVGNITIDLASNNSILDKPLIVVEGFDPENSFDFRTFVEARDIGGINVALNSSLTLNEAIESEGYDLVFVNFQNSTDYIQRNAYMVEKVIEWVNNNKVGSQKNVVMGLSMGGLVSRYALRHMETTGKTHQTKLYISHDTPHQGANVPLSFQAMVRHLSGESFGYPVFYGIFNINVKSLNDAIPGLSEGYDLVNSPAARQMLSYQLSGSGNNISNTTNTLYNSFMTEYKNLGNPVQGGIRNVAISNASECGTSLNYLPYATLVNVNETKDLPFFVTNIALGVLNALTVNPLRTLTSYFSTNTDIKAEFVARALPDHQSKQIYKGKLYIKKKVLFVINVEEDLISGKTLNSTTSMLPLDNSNGGIYDINQFVTLPSSISDYVLEQRFSFIPVNSSLNIGQGNQTIVTADLNKVYSPLIPPSSPKNIPFANFFTNPENSEIHTQFTRENGTWLLEELQGVSAFYTCVGSCVSPNLQVSGPSSICASTNATFSISNLVSGYPVNWTFGSGVTYVSGQGTKNITIKASASSSSQRTITANIATDCGTLSLTKNFWAGPQPVTPLLVSPTGNMSSSSTPTNVYFDICVSYGSTNTHINLTGVQNLQAFVYGSGPQPQVVNGSVYWTMPSSSYSGTIRLEYDVTCGHVIQYVIFNNTCYSYIVYPNPASNEITVENTNEGDEYSRNAADRRPELGLYDKNGTLLLSTEMEGTKTTLDVSGLPNGHYYLRIVDQSGQKIEHQIIVNH